MLKQTKEIKNVLCTVYARKLDMSPIITLHT